MVNLIKVNLAMTSLVKVSLIMVNLPKVSLAMVNIINFINNINYASIPMVTKLHYLA
jgi:hypothetical protein